MVIDIEQEAIELMKKELPLVTTMTLKKIPGEIDTPLQEIFEIEDISDAAEVCFKAFNIKHENFDLDNYYPWHSKGFFSRKEPKQDKQALTIRMFAESAKAGRWLYD